MRAVFSTMLRGLVRMLRWRLQLSALIGCLVVSVLIMPIWDNAYSFLLGRSLISGLVVLLAFGVFERWPARLPVWLPRWVVHMAGVAIAVPLAVAIGYKGQPEVLPVSRS